MFITIILGLIFLIIVFIGDISGVMVCGVPKKDSEYLEYIEKLRNSNPYLLDGTKSDSMISSNITDGFISDSIQGILFGCYISNMGIVPRWYKSYGEINKLREELKNK